MSYGSQTRNPDEHDDNPVDPDEGRYTRCGCGDPRCFLDAADNTNLQIQGTWFNAYCVGLCSHCGELDDLKALYKESFGRLRHLRLCGDDAFEQVRR